MTYDQNHDIVSELILQVHLIAYKEFLTPYRHKFKQYALKGDVESVKKDIAEIFDKNTGLPHIISQLKHSKGSFYYFPKVVKNNIKRLERTYLYKFSSYVKQHRSNSIDCLFKKLLKDLQNISTRLCIEYKPRLTLKEILQQRKN